MKKYLFLFVTAVSLALFPGRAHAQRYLPGMKGVELRGGFANGSKSPLNHYAGFAVSGYTKRADRWVIGTEYLMKNYGYRERECALRTVHGRRRLLPEIPVGPDQDGLSLHRRFRTGRL